MILDTNALSAFADDAPAAVAAVSHAERIYLPVVVLGEYRYGIAHAGRPRDHEDWLLAFLRTCHVLDLTQKTATWYADIRSELRRIGKPIPANDAWKLGSAVLCCTMTPAPMSGVTGPNPTP